MMSNTTVHRSSRGPATLVADVGGTFARLGLAVYESGRFVVHSVRKYRGRDYNSLADIITAYLKATARPDGPRACSVAIAGLIQDDAVTGSNLAWRVDKAQIRAAAGDVPTSFVNDFYAVALGVRHDKESVETCLQAGDSDGGTIAVLGPGTGFGAAVILDEKDKAPVLRTEAGHMSFTPASEREKALADCFRERHHRPIVESFVSGPGLSNICECLTILEGGKGRRLSAQEICTAAASGEDAFALQAVHHFCEMFGSACRDLALAYYADGGVYLAGGMTGHLKEFLADGRFLQRFLDDEEMVAFLRRVPINIIDGEAAALVGAAAAAGTGR